MGGGEHVDRNEIEASNEAAGGGKPEDLPRSARFLVLRKRRARLDRDGRFPARAQAQQRRDPAQRLLHPQQRKQRAQQDPAQPAIAAIWRLYVTRQRVREEQRQRQIQRGSQHLTDSVGRRGDIHVREPVRLRAD